jgi:hypothetical protein
MTLHHTCSAPSRSTASAASARAISVPSPWRQYCGATPQPISACWPARMMRKPSPMVPPVRLLSAATWNTLRDSERCSIRQRDTKARTSPSLRSRLVMNSW